MNQNAPNFRLGAFSYFIIRLDCLDKDFQLLPEFGQLFYGHILHHFFLGGSSCDKVTIQIQILQANFSIFFSFDTNMNYVFILTGLSLVIPPKKHTALAYGASVGTSERSNTPWHCPPGQVCAACDLLGKSCR